MNVILASTSTIFGGAYLEYLLPEVAHLFKDCDEIIFIPFARASGLSHDDYTEKVAIAFSKIGKKVKGLHAFTDPNEALRNAKGIFTGGGNTFLLVKQMHEQNLMKPLRDAIHDGCAYLGTSAGSNLAGLTMKTTNDMPIVYPPSFDTLGIVPFNINPHYTDSPENTEHMGETREMRIMEFHKINSEPVIGLREGNWLEVNEDSIMLKGIHTARIFKQNQMPIEVAPKTDLKSLADTA